MTTSYLYSNMDQHLKPPDITTVSGENMSLGGTKGGWVTAVGSRQLQTSKSLMRSGFIGSRSNTSPSAAACKLTELLELRGLWVRTQSYARKRSSGSFETERVLHFADEAGPRSAFSVDHFVCSTKGDCLAAEARQIKTP
jgi:hypothetical protein